MNFFEPSTRNLLAQGAAAGARHPFALSVVGMEPLPDRGCFRAKISQERLMNGSSILFSIVHATRFFEFLKELAGISFDGGKLRLPDALPKASRV